MIADKENTNPKTEDEVGTTSDDTAFSFTGVTVYTESNLLVSGVTGNNDVHNKRSNAT